MDVYFDALQLNHQPSTEWSDGKAIHHFEKAARAEVILDQLKSSSDVFRLKEPFEGLREDVFTKIHDPSYLKAFKLSKHLGEKKFFPSVFAYGEKPKNPTNIKHLGSFCFDSLTPVMAQTYQIAEKSALCAISGALALASGEKVSYALCRPPGHHAGRDVFGGYCYFNNAALAAKTLSEKGYKVAILDIDFHHGNGTQSIFYQDPSILTVSIHGDPEDYFPYFSGSAIETGKGKGEGFNVNIPLPEGSCFSDYLKVLREKGFSRIRDFCPDVLVVSAGFDTHKDDPLGGFGLETADYQVLAEEIRLLARKTLIVQEGGYHVGLIGENVARFLYGFL